MWYVIGSLNRQNELKIRDALRLDGKECFVPLRYELVKVKDKVSGKKGHKKTQERKERQLVPAIPGMVFIKEFDSVDKMKDYFLHRKERVFLKKSTFTNKEDYLSVTDHDMENFIAITEKAGERITYYEPGEIQLRPGDRIRVNGGLYDGREGIIMRVKGKRRKQLVVSIPGVLIASVEMEPDLVELTSTLSTEASEKPTKSKDVEGDKQLVMRLAKRLLFEIPEAYQHEKEYYLLLSELNRAAFRLRSMKGYVSSQEAELALALYLAAFKLQQNQEAAEARLRKAIDRLQDTSLLKVRAQMYLAVLSKDEKLFALVQERINAIKAQKLSMKQKLLLEDFESLSPKIVF
jgi:transcription antitermination factor NusG